MSDINLYNEAMDILASITNNRDMKTQIPEGLLEDKGFMELYGTLSELRKALLSLGLGDLNCPIKGRGYMIGTIKSLQAALRHLTWQTKLIASGDLTQKVDFMGEFSDSFNSMTQAMDKAIQDLKKSEEKYRVLFENALESIIVVQDKKIRLCNTMFENLTGYTLDEMQTMDIKKFIYAEDVQLVTENHNKQIQNEGQGYSLLSRIVRKDNTVRWVQINGVQIEWNEHKAILYFVGDITKRKMVEDALKQSEEKYRLLAETPSDVIWVLNLKRNQITYVSPSIYHLRGYTAEEVMNMPWESSMAPETAKELNKLIQERKKAFLRDSDASNYYINEVQQRHKDGHLIWVEISTKYRFNAAGEIELISVSRNIDRRKKTEQQVLYLSYHDQLTGLYNRRYYEEVLKQLDTEENLPVSLIMADVNGLKLTNDAFGHMVGDELLKCISEILKRNARDTDIIARIGGDEFVMLLPKTNADYAKKVIARMREYLKQTTSDKIIISVSFGLGTKVDINESFDNTFMQAENNMYQKKLLESRSMKNETIKLINSSLYERDGREQQHSERVSKLCVEIGKAMGMNQDALDELNLLGLFHDIGKIGVNEQTLNKPEQLNDAEWAEIKRHPEIGYQILRSINEFATIADYVLAHHERMDGKGYPRKLKGEQIPLQSRILTISDAYDSMTHNYPYKSRLNIDQAIKELRTNSNTQFDGEIVDTFINQVLCKKRQA